VQLDEVAERRRDEHAEEAADLAPEEAGGQPLRREREEQDEKQPRQRLPRGREVEIDAQPEHHHAGPRCPGHLDEVRGRLEQVVGAESDEGAGREAEGKQDQLHEAGREPARAAHHVAICEFHHAEGEHGARQERHEGRHEHVKRIHGQAAPHRVEDERRYERCRDHRHRHRQDRPPGVEHLRRAHDRTQQRRGGEVRERRHEHHRHPDRQDRVAHDDTGRSEPRGLAQDALEPVQAFARRHRPALGGLPQRVHVGDLVQAQRL
jgi:hypothetical protein